MTTTHITPSPNRSLPPRFYEIDSKRFEHLCRALFDKEPHLHNVDFYEIDGLDQFGIDIVGHRHDGSGAEVVSCKCHENTIPSKIKEFSEDFLKHLDTNWKNWRIRRFILAIAADTSRATIQKAILTEAERFMALGIRYQIWNPAKLQELLRPHPGIVGQYLDREWISRICGHSEPVETPRTDTSAVLNAAVIAQLSALQQKLSGHTSARIEQALERIRSGESAAVETELRAIRHDAVEWSSLFPDTQAKVLRLMASCRLSDGDIPGAEILAGEADAVSPSEEPRLRSLIALYREGHVAALSILGSPITQDGANLRLAMMIEVSDYAGAENMLAEHPLLQSPDAETWRLRAHLNFERNDREAAVAAIREAERLKPDWLRVREDGGRMRYAAAVSRALPPGTLRGPNPIDLDLVKEDDVSRQLLDEALLVFTGILERLAKEDDRTEIETWRLAVFSARRDRLDEAEIYAHSLLDRDPTHWGAIAWSLARGFPLGKKATLAAIELRLIDRTAEPPHMAAAMLICLSDDDTTEARRLFNCYSAQFETENGKALMAQWGQRLQNGEGGETTKRVFSLRVEDVIERARQTQDWSPATTLLADAVKDDVGCVLPICQSLAAAGRWNEIAPYIDTLIDDIATAEAVRLACHATYHSNSPERALALIGRYPEFVANAELPIDLKRLEINLREVTGDIITALRQSEGLRTVTTDPRDAIREAELAFRIGDTKRAETLIGRKDVTSALPPHDALKWAAHLKSQNPKQASRLLLHAVETGIQREAIPSAFNLALHLPDREIIQRIGPTFQSLAQEGEGNGHIKVFSIDSLDEVAKIIAADRENAERLSRMYNDGEIPPHLVIGRLRENFAHLYMRNGKDDTATPFRRRLSPLWIRHGIRPPVTLPDNDIFISALYVDISSLLLAEGIGLLDVLNQAGIGLRLPCTLPQALSELEFHAGDHQPDVVAAHRKIRQAITSGAITVRDDDDFACAAGGRIWRIVHDRNAQDDNATTIDNQGISILPLSALRAALHATGRIDVTELADEHASSETLPSSGDTLLFEFNTIESSTEDGLFDALIGCFRVEVERCYLDHIDTELAIFERNQDLARRLAELRQQTAQNIQSGGWRLAPHREVEEHADMYSHATAVERCLLDLLRIPAEEKAVIWIDDRSLSRHASAETHPLIGITDILAALRTAEYIDDEQYYLFLLMLRRSRAHLLPITPEEVLHHLRKACVNEEGVVETPALRTLRQHFADALSLEEFWDVPEPGDKSGEHRELKFVVGLTRLFEQAMIPIWTADNIDLRRRTAWLDWAYSSLQPHSLKRLPLVGGSDAKQSLAALNIASLFSSVIAFIGAGQESRQEQCRNLVHWLDTRVFQPALYAGKINAQQVAQFLADMMIAHFKGDDVDGDSRRGIHWIIRRFVKILPNEIREILYERADFIECFEIKFITTINLDDVEFENNDFWRAIACARSGRKAKLISLDGKAKVTLFRPRRRTHNQINITGDLNGRLAEKPELALVGGSGASRRRMLEQHPEWFDLPPDDRTVAIAEIADAPTPAERMKRLADRQGHSVPYRLAQWVNAIRSRESVELSAPASAHLLRYLRLDVVPNNPATALIRANERLTLELGAPEAMRRFAYLPIPLPPSVVDGLEALESSERTKRLARGPAGPIARLQWLGLLQQFKCPIFAAEVDRVLEDWKQRADAFLSILRWANNCLAEDADWRALPGPYRLVLTWAYAGLITEVFLGRGVSPASINEHFTKSSPIPRVDLGLIHDPAYDDSPLFPSVVMDDASLLYHGMAMVVGTDGAQLLSQAQRLRLEELLSFNHEGRRHATASLYRNWRMFDDPLGSMFSMRPVGVFDTLPDVTDEEAVQAVLKCTIGLAETPTSSSEWVAYLIAGGMPAFERPETLKALKALDVVTLSASGSGEGFALRMAAEATARSRDTEAIAKFADGLFAGAAILARRFSTPVYPPGPVEKPEHPAQIAATHLLEALAQLSKRQDLSGATAFLADGLLRLAAAWPSATPYWRHVAEGVLNRLPFEPGSEMVGAWTLLRAEV